jgi:hypothetical protein
MTRWSPQVISMTHTLALTFKQNRTLSSFPKCFCDKKDSFIHLIFLIPWNIPFQEKIMEETWF